MQGAGEIWAVLGRTAVLYVLTFLVLRGMGKRTVGNMAPFDVTVVVFMGEALALGVEEVRKPILTAVFPIVFLGLLQMGLTYVNLKFRPMERFTQGESRVLVKDGQILWQNLARERFTEEDLFIGLREAGVDRVQDVKEARLEPTGKVSVILADEAAPVTPRQLSPSQIRAMVEPIVQQHVESLRQEIRALRQGSG